MAIQQQRSAYALGEFPLPFGNLADRAVGLAMLLSLMVWVPLRRKIGIGYVSKTNIAASALLMLGLSWWGNFHFSVSWLLGAGGLPSGNDESLVSYTLFVFLPLAVWQHASWLRDEKAGTQTHRYWHGFGWFEFLPLPQKAQQKFVDPAIAFLAGALLYSRLGAPLLGFWVMVAAVAFFVVEFKLFAQAIEAFRVGHDIEHEAGLTAYMVAQRPARSEAGAGAASVPTGVDADILARIERNRREIGNA